MRLLCCALMRQSADLAAKLVERISFAQGRLSTQDLKLHSDNGSPMKGYSMRAMLYKLGISHSYSRPRVSNDNPYVESIFKTMKYRSSYPVPDEDGFETLDAARKWGVKVCRVVYAMRLGGSSAEPSP